jgi:putative iron-dependent peroxidase
MPATDGDLFFHIRASNEAVVYECQTQFQRVLAPITSVLDETKGFRYFEGRAIIGFIDGTEAPAIEDAADYALVGEEDPQFINGSYAFAQKWQHDMPIWEHMTTGDQEKAVGREKFSDFELDDDDKFKNAHNVASKYEVDGVEQKIVRMNVPYAQPAVGNIGTYFIGYARHWTVTKGMLQNMVDQGDFLLTFSKLLSGQVFFIPSRDLLAQIADDDF